MQLVQHWHALVPNLRRSKSNRLSPTDRGILAQRGSVGRTGTESESAGQGQGAVVVGCSASCLLPLASCLLILLRLFPIYSLAMGKSEYNDDNAGSLAYETLPTVHPRQSHSELPPGATLIRANSRPESLALTSVNTRRSSNSRWSYQSTLISESGSTSPRWSKFNVQRAGSTIEEADEDADKDSIVAAPPPTVFINEDPHMSKFQHLASVFLPLSGFAVISASLWLYVIPLQFIFPSMSYFG